MRAPLPTTDALFAQEVEQKMSNLLAGLSAVQSFLDRTKHRTATQLAAAESSPRVSLLRPRSLASNSIRQRRQRASAPPLPPPCAEQMAIAAQSLADPRRAG